MKQQLQRLGFSYPWSREIATCDPEYYRWNQWFFLRMLEKGIAYRANSPVNWCPSCQTVLANEQAEGGICWRCKNEVEQRDMEQWFLRITDYQDQLLDDMDQLDAWPDRVLVQQKNWVGKSPGAEVDFPVDGLEPIRVFTTRVDTIYGATFMVLAPEHPMVDAVLEGASDAAKRKEQIGRLRAQDRRARLEGRVEKEGVFTGRYATNPYSGEQIPIWVGNFVLMGYGTGAIMSVPAHDQRDFEFARKYDLNVRVVIQPEGPELDGATMEEAYDGDGTSGEQRSLRRPPVRGGHPEDGRLGRGEGLRQGDHHLPPQGLAHQPPALLGHADPGRLLREGRDRSRPRRPSCRSCSRPTPPSPARAATRSRRSRRS